MAGRAVHGEIAPAWVHRLQPQGRPRALLQANRLLVAALCAAGRTDDAKQTLAHIAAQCAELGMVRYLLDGGPRVVALLAELRDDLHSDRWRPIWPAIPPVFLDTMESQAQSTSSGAASQRLAPLRAASGHTEDATAKPRRPGPPTAGVAPPSTGAGTPT